VNKINFKYMIDTVTTVKFNKRSNFIPKL